MKVTTNNEISVERFKNEIINAVTSADVIKRQINGVENVFDNMFSSMELDNRVQKFEIRRARDGRDYFVLISQSVTNRIANEVTALLEDTDKDKLTEFLAIGSNTELFVEFLRTQALKREILSPYQQSKLNGATMRMEMLKRAGGLFKSKDVERLLHVKRQTVTDKRNRGELLGVKIGGVHKYPVFQFDGQNLVKGLQKITKSLIKQGDDFWSSCLFLLNTHDALFDEKGENISPLDAVKMNMVAEVLSLVKMKHEQIAG